MYFNPIRKHCFYCQEMSIPHITGFPLCRLHANFDSWQHEHESYEENVIAMKKCVFLTRKKEHLLTLELSDVATVAFCNIFIWSLLVPKWNFLVYKMKDRWKAWRKTRTFVLADSEEHRLSCMYLIHHAFELKWTTMQQQFSKHVVKKLVFCDG